MIADAIDTVTALGWALVAWIVVLAALGTLLTLIVAATLAWTVSALRRHARRPSWARNRLRARRFARRTRRQHDYQEAA